MQRTKQTFTVLLALIVAATCANSAKAAHPNYLSVVVGGLHACATASAGVECWGLASHGAIGGIPYLGTSNLPRKVPDINVAPDKVSVGDSHSCALVSGSVKCWGSPYHGATGDGGQTYGRPPYGSPVDVVDLGDQVTDLSAGSATTCVVESGAAKCWGLGYDGQLGDGGNGDSSSPRQVPGMESGVTKVSVGFRSACAIQYGSIYCWGGGYGAPRQVAIPEPSGDVTAIAVGSRHACAVAGGDAWCWGANDNGQLGHNWGLFGLFPPDQVETPVKVDGLTASVSDITVGNSHTCAISSGGAKCWGANSYGQLGQDNTDASGSPKSVLGFTDDVTSLNASNGQSTCGIQDGRPMCWGYNFYGQLGDGTTRNRQAPVEVGGADWSERFGDLDAACEDYEIMGVRGSRGHVSEVSPNNAPTYASDATIKHFMARLREEILYSDTKRSAPRGPTLSDPQWVVYDAAVAGYGGATSKHSTLLWVAALSNLNNPVGQLASLALISSALAYENSVNQGVERLGERLAARRAHCSNEGVATKFILVGFSQGAQVIGRAIDHGMDTAGVKAIALMGDPTFKPGHSGTAIYASGPNKSSLPQGIIEPRKTSLPTTAKVFSACRLHDPVCGSFRHVKDSTEEHSRYARCSATDSGVEIPPETYLLAKILRQTGLGMSQVPNGDERACGAPGGFERMAAPRSAVTIDVGTPRALLGFSTVAVRPGTTVDLSACQSHDPAGSELSYEWDVDGDGTYDADSAECDFSHKFVEPTGGPVSLQVTNMDGLSDHATAEVSVDEDAPTAPSVPTNVRTSSASSKILVAWDPPTDTGGSAVVGYEVRDSVRERVIAWVPGSARALEITDLPNGLEASFQVRAWGGIWAGAWSAPSQVVTSTDRAPADGTPSPPAVKFPYFSKLSGACMRRVRTCRISVISSQPGRVQLNPRTRLRGRWTELRSRKFTMRVGRNSLSVSLPRTISAKLARTRKVRVSLEITPLSVLNPVKSQTLTELLPFK